ncbi:MAG TPA: hypothetical protein V6C88_07490, partial [Chroococcidiopsis sp.]
MTGSTQPPGSGEAFKGIGVSPENEGRVLQRGGQELLLEKAGDRFTVRLVAGASAEQVGQRLGAASQQGIPSVQLVEYRVEPSQLDLAMERARTLADVVFSSHVYRLQSSPNTWVYLTDELTIQFADTVDRAEIAAMVARLGLQAVQPVLGVPQTFVFRVTDRAAVNPIKLANQLMRRGDVLTAEPNIAIETQSHYRPSDPEYPKQWYLNH